MDSEHYPSGAFCVRAARPADVPALMRLKRLLAEGENSLHAVRATAADWLRDGFGADAGFTAFVAEAEYAEDVIGMATCSRRTITGWSGPVVFLQDLFVEPQFRKHGVAGALVARVAAYARELGSPIVRAYRPCRQFRTGLLSAQWLPPFAALSDLRLGRSSAGRAGGARQRSTQKTIPRRLSPMVAAKQAVRGFRF